ncbi:MAG: PAS domain S-box protein [Calditrichaeota bacterium]|nr:MAG: PAS domain S-box protein [Calditrichota bacterium]
MNKTTFPFTNLSTEEFYRQLLDSVKNAVVVVDEEMQILYANHSFLRMIGLDNSDLFKEDLSSFLSEGLKILRHVFHEIDSGKKVEELPLILKGNDGTVKEVLLSAYPVQMKPPERKAFILVLEKRNLSSPALQQSIRKEKIKIVNSLSGVLAHEIINIINILSGRIQLLMHRQGLDNMEKVLGVMQRQINRISSIVSKLESLNRAREDSIPEEVVVVRFLSEFIRKHHQKFQATFILDTRKEFESVAIQANESHMEDAFGYLFDILDNLPRKNSEVKITCQITDDVDGKRYLQMDFFPTLKNSIDVLIQPFPQGRNVKEISSLDVALMQTIFSLYGVRMEKELVDGEESLRLQFPVVGL